MRASKPHSYERTAGSALAALGRPKLLALLALTSTCLTSPRLGTPACSVGTATDA